MFTADFSVTPRNSVIVSLWHNLWSKDKIAEIRLGLSLPADMYVITCYCTLVPDRKQSKGEIFGMHVTWELHAHLLQFLWKLMNLGAKNRRNTTVSWELKFEVNISKMYKEVNFENLLLICYNFRVSILIIKKIPSNKHFLNDYCFITGRQFLKPWPSEWFLWVCLNMHPLSCCFSPGRKLTDTTAIFDSNSYHIFWFKIVLVDLPMLL